MDIVYIWRDIYLKNYQILWLNFFMTASWRMQCSQFLGLMKCMIFPVSLPSQVAPGRRVMVLCLYL